MFCDINLPVNLCNVMLGIFHLFPFIFFNLFSVAWTVPCYFAISRTHLWYCLSVLYIHPFSRQMNLLEETIFIMWALLTSLWSVSKEMTIFFFFTFYLTSSYTPTHILFSAAIVLWLF